ncbi:hypothetical protein ACHAWF_001241 [Thalassiosira exigua]
MSSPQTTQDHLGT